MQMQTMFGENKPNCIILDEIDGATSGGESRSAVNAIVKMIKNTTAAAKDAKDGDRVTRPIICICNNLYAPALRPLRGVCKIFMMRETRSERLMARIKTICRHEHIVLRADALNILCKRTDNDIRSCLNTLQFLSTRCSLISRDMIMNTCVGHKDRKVALFDAWKSIFHTKAEGAKRSTQIARAVAHVRSRGSMKEDAAVAKGEGKSVKSSSLLDVMSMASQLGRDIDRVMDGIHENFLLQHYNDPMLSKSCAALNWLCFSDICSRRAHKYVPIGVGGVHLLCKSNVTPVIQYPRQAWENKQNIITNTAILTTFTTGMSKKGGVKTKENVVKDILSTWLDIISPRVRPISKSLMSNWEQRQIDGLVDLLCTQSITFAPEVAKRGEYKPQQSFWETKQAPKLVLDPPVHTLVEFSDQALTDSHHQLSSDVIRTIVHEIELQNMRKNDRSSSSNASPTGVIVSPGGTTRKRTRNDATTSSSSSMSKISKITSSSAKFDKELTEKEKEMSLEEQIRGANYKDNSNLITKEAVKKKAYVHRDFFGRPVSTGKGKNGKKRVRAPSFKKMDTDENNANDSSKKGKSNEDGCSSGKKHLLEEEVVASLTLFKFTPGYTNAVKRRVNICEFF